MTLHSLTLQHVSASDCHHQGAQTKLKTIYNKPNYNKSAVMEFSHTVNSAVLIDLQINDTGQVLVHSSTQLPILEQDYIRYLDIVYRYC
jgi:hypothetical protein